MWISFLWQQNEIESTNQKTFKKKLYKEIKVITPAAGIENNQQLTT